MDSVKRTKPIPGGQNESEYRSVMRKIVEGLTKDNLNTMLFLCKDYIPRGREMNTALELLKYLEDRDLVSQYSAVFMAEALHIIRRMDLLKLIPCIRNKRQFEEEFLGFAYSLFTPYRVLTVQLQEELSQRDFQSFRYECSQHLNISSIDSANNVLSLLWKLEEEDIIHGEDYEELLKILESIDNVRPLNMFKRLLDGDETVVLPHGKKQRRQNSEQDMFPDRRSSSTSTPSPSTNPPSYRSVGRVEAMPYMYPPSSGHILRASVSSGAGELPVTKQKYLESMEPARYNFDDPDGAIKVTDARWFSPDEVTPKAPVASKSDAHLRMDHERMYPNVYAEPLRMDSPQSLPPGYNYQNSREYRSWSYNDFSSLPPTSPPHYEEFAHHHTTPPRLHGVATYPQMQGIEGQRMAPEASLPPHPLYDSPPQSYFQQVSSPPAGYHNVPMQKYHHPPTAQDSLIPRQDFHPDHFGRPHHYNSTAIAPLQERMENLELATVAKCEKDECVREKQLSDLSDAAEAKSSALDLNQEAEDFKKYEEIKEKILKEQKNFASYKMDSSPVGLCILINNVKFAENRKVEEHRRRESLNAESDSKKYILPNIDLADREGSDRDADKLETLFERLDFKVQRYNDLDHRAMGRVLQEAGELDHSEYDCFLLIVLSHGESGCVFGVDGFRITFNELQTMFVAEKCSTLANKPKIIIIQACQGAKTMPVAYAPEADVIAHDGPVLNDIADNGTPNKADFLMAYSTVPGYISYRSRLEGSYYVQEIVRIFKQFHETQDLLSMMVMVTDAVGKYQKKQVPMPIPTLRKKVFFHLKQGCTLDDLDDSRVTEYPSIESSYEHERVVQESGVE